MNFKKYALPVVLIALSACSMQTDPADDGSASSSVASSAVSSASAPAPVARLQKLPLEKRSTRYVNDRLGFSLLIPTYLVYAGQCDYSPMPENGYPVKAIEDGDTVYITPAMYAYSRHESPDSTTYTCINVDVTLDTIKKDMVDKLWYYSGWKMVFRKGITTDSQLLSFIREWYGPSCGIKAKNPAAQDGVFDVEIDGATTALEAENSDCPLNFSYVVQYAPAKQTAVTWKIGQDGRFEDMDTDMIRSFRFE